MADNNLGGVFIYFAVCIVIGLAYGAIIYYQFRVVDTFKEHLVGGFPPIGKLLFIYAPNCPHTPKAREIYDSIDTQGRLDKVEIDCTSPEGMAICHEAGIKTVPSFGVVTDRLSQRITDWRNIKEINDVITRALEPIPVNVVISN